MSFKLRFIFFTKTIWNEQPRLRHQLAKSLKKLGHEIVFFQKPNYFFNKAAKVKSKEKGIKLAKHKQLIHHRLRLNFFFHFLNYLYEKKKILETCKKFKVDNEDIIINFNYDYFFLRKLFFKNKIVTIINDDFLDKSLFSYRKPFRKVFEKTIIKSNIVLTVSKILKKDMSKISNNVKLFLPWTDLEYCKPKKNNKNKIIYWGYINNRIDFEYLLKLSKKIKSLDPSIQIVFYGPNLALSEKAELFFKQSNVRLNKAKDLEKINISNCFAAIIPYKSSSGRECITLPNKALPLLSKGLPLLVKGMPNFINKKFVIKLPDNLDKAAKIIIDLKIKYKKYQSDISKFVYKNRENVRIKQFNSFLNL